MELELKRKYPYLDYKTEIASVRDLDKLDMLFNKYKPEILFHAAAHKHVPLMENNPEEAIKNNIFGTKNVAECCLKYKLESVVLISTDKAVNPTNVMGATKRVCEMIFQKYSEKDSNTKFMAVRFGNVLGSNGSVIPIFSKLIEEGKNLTLTHKDIIRYFMTIPEVFKQMPFGHALAILFFISVVFAAVSSLQNMFEVVGESIITRFKMSRKAVIFLLAIVSLVIGIFIEPENKVGPWMDVVTIYIIPFGAVLGAISWYWLLKKESYMEELNLGSKVSRSEMYHTIGKYIYVPLVLVVFVLGVIYHGIG